MRKTFAAAFCLLGVVAAFAPQAVMAASAEEAGASGTSVSNLVAFILIGVGIAAFVASAIILKKKKRMRK